MLRLLEMFWQISVCLLFLMMAHSLIIDDPASMQLVEFKAAHPNPVGTLTSSSGAPISVSELSTIDSNLIQNEFFMNSMTLFVRERIPERVVHAIGAGASGYFEVTHDVTNICKAKLFDCVGKKTPVTVRFSTSQKSRGGSETERESRGFAIKFYTEEGNLDIVALNTPVFNILDPVDFPSLSRSLKTNPVTNIFDNTMFWDFVVRRPASLFDVIILRTGRGTPDGYRHMPGFSIHCYQVVNKRGESHFMRFHILPDAGEKYLNSSEAIRLAGSDPSYATKDLYNAIARGDFPSWSVKVQILSVSDALKSRVNPFDVTKLLPEKDFPLQPLGRIVLNKNPDNWFAEVDLLAYCPFNLVPGILGAQDKVFEARSFAYRDAHNHRLGGNNEKIPVNCPYRTKVWTYNRDGVPPVGDNMNGTPNFFPNDFSGPVPTTSEPQLLYLRNDFTSNMNQISEYFAELPKYEQESVTSLLATSMCSIPEFLKRQVLALLSRVSYTLGRNVAKEIQYC